MEIAAIITAVGTLVGVVLAFFGTRAGNKKADEQKAAAQTLEQERQELVDARAISDDRRIEIARLREQLSEEVTGRREDRAYLEKRLDDSEKRRERAEQECRGAEELLSRQRQLCSDNSHQLEKRVTTLARALHDEVAKASAELDVIASQSHRVIEHDEELPS